MEKFIILGASRGLGWSTYERLAQKHLNAQFLLVSRKINDLDTKKLKNTTLLSQDFSKTPVNQAFVGHLFEFQPTQIIYFAGGGPYGIFQSKKWADHLWSLNTSFLYPAELLHIILSRQEQWVSLQKITFIGSSVAENKADPNAASYAAAKHALKGLIDTVNSEQKNKLKVQLFSPGYMQTDLLPANSHPRLTDRAERPEVVADRLIEYIEKS